MRRFQAAGLALACSVACSAGGNGSTDPFANQQPGGGNGGGGAGGDQGIVPIGGGQPFTPGDPNAAIDAGCPAIKQKAEVVQGGKADLIFMVDASGSMTEEVAAVQNNMNTFSKQIVASGIDAHVVLLAISPLGGPPVQCPPGDIACPFISLANFNGVCIGPDLGLPGACPTQDESNPAAGFLHFHAAVDSHNALSTVQWSLPSWQSMLRADAAKTFVVVTDDDANPTPNATEFASWVNSQAVFQGAVWRFSGVFCSTNGSNCANVGATYQQLVTQTGGIVGDLAQFSAGNADAQFKAVFDSLAQAVKHDARPVDCAWNIPPPPDGDSLQNGNVNVHYTSNGTTQTIYGVPSANDCTDKYFGWYYDDPANPTRVMACPQACTVMQADPNAIVDVIFGCAPEQPPIK